MTKDLITLGPVIGSGQYRTVHAITGHDDLVAKIERVPVAGRFPHNDSEWSIWTRGYKGRLILAPCVGLLNAGRVLIMARTTPISPAHLHLIPHDFLDRHIGNFGWFKGEIVCHDYAFWR